MAFDTNGILVPTGTSDAAFYNSNRDQPIDPGVPELIDRTQDLVADALQLNQDYAADAVERATAAINALGDLDFPPELPDPPAPPAINTSFQNIIQLGFETLPNWGEIPQEDVEQFFATPVIVPDIASEIPDYVPVVTDLNIPDAPTLNLPAAIDVPVIETEFDVPDAPTPDYGSTPSLEEILLPVYEPQTLPVFGDEAPEFDVLPPDPFIAWTEPVYASTVKDAVSTVISAMLAGGTGIPAAVERDLWERGRQREDVGAQKTIDEATDGFSARGFSAPQGMLNGQIIAVREEAARKATELSREIAIKDADLEQKNRQFAVTSALDFERIYVAIFLAIVERNFQIAKFTVETVIQVFNLEVTVFNVEQQVFAQKVLLYKTQLDAAFFQLKAFEALVEVEKAKGILNQSRAAVYESRVRAYGIQVDAYGKLIDSVRTRAELQKNRVEVFRAQVESNVSLINGERAKFEAYDSQIKGETAKIGLEEANARVYSVRVQAIGERASVLLKQADVDLAVNRQKLEWNIANMQRVTANNNSQLNKIQANLAAYQGITGRALARYQAEKESRSAELQAQVSLGGIAIAKYQAMNAQWQTRSNQIIGFVSIQAEQSRAAASAASTLAAGAMAGTHVSAGISAGASASQSNARSSSDNTSQSRNVSENSNYSVTHNYQHRV